MTRRAATWAAGTLGGWALGTATGFGLVHGVGWLAMGRAPGEAIDVGGTVLFKIALGGARGRKHAAHNA